MEIFIPTQDNDEYRKFLFPGASISFILPLNKKQNKKFVLMFNFLCKAYLHFWWWEKRGFFGDFFF